jgi:hypothetical protein
MRFSNEPPGGAQCLRTRHLSYVDIIVQAKLDDRLDGGGEVLCKSFGSNSLGQEAV